MNNKPIIVNLDTPAFVAWLAACKKMCEDYDKANYPTLGSDILIPNCGGRYIRINETSEELDKPSNRPIRDSVWAFIDRTTGDVLKPASYKAPAKHARGNIFDEKGGMGSMSSYGPAYLR